MASAIDSVYDEEELALYREDESPIWVVYLNILQTVAMFILFWQKLAKSWTENEQLEYL